MNLAIIVTPIVYHGLRLLLMVLMPVGITETTKWQGGGGYRFYELAPTLIVKDEHGNDVFSDKYNAQMLVAAVAKVNGYFYAPVPDVFWKQGYSQDNSFIYVTTQYLTAAMLDSLAKEVDAFESLLICARLLM